MDQKGRRGSSSHDSPGNGSTATSGSSSSSPSRRRSSKTLGILQSPTKNTGSSGETKENLPKPIRAARRNSSSPSNDGTAAAVQSSSSSLTLTPITRHSSVAAAAAALAATSPSTLPPLQQQILMSQAINESGSSGAFNSGAANGELLPIPSSLMRRRASTNPAMLNLQRRFGLASSSGEEGSSSSSSSTVATALSPSARNSTALSPIATTADNQQYYQYQYSSPNSSPGMMNNNDGNGFGVSSGGGGGGWPLTGGGGHGGGGHGGGGVSRRRHSVGAFSTSQWEQQQQQYEHQYGVHTDNYQGRDLNHQATNNTAAVTAVPRPTQRTRVSQLPHGWIQYWCPTEQTYYYYHPTTDHSTWEKPLIISSTELPGEAQFRRKRFRLLCEIGAWGSAKETPLEVKLDRNHMVYESVSFVMRLTPGQLRIRFKIVYNGETGIDSGGLTKDWYLELSRSLMSSKSQLGLFSQSENSGLFSIDSRSHISVQEYKRMYRFVGRLIGKAIYDRHVLDVPLCHFLFKRILRQIPDLEDMKELDLVYYTSLNWILDNNITDAIDETFSVLRNEFGAMVVVDLCPNGRNIDVTELNKQRYVQAVVDYKTGSSIKPQLDALLLGFGEIIPRHAIKSLSASELKALVNGKDTIDAATLRAGVKYSGSFVDTDPLVQRFWTAFTTMSDADRQNLLRFVTGTCRVPLDGFDPPFTLTPSDMGENALPMAHTCFNQLVLPGYSTVELLLKQLKIAVKHGNAQGFHLT